MLKIIPISMVTEFMLDKICKLTLPRYLGRVGYIIFAY